MRPVPDGVECSIVTEFGSPHHQCVGATEASNRRVVSRRLTQTSLICSEAADLDTDRGAVADSYPQWLGGVFDGSARIGTAARAPGYTYGAPGPDRIDELVDGPGLQVAIGIMRKPQLPDR